MSKLKLYFTFVLLLSFLSIAEAQTKKNVSAASPAIVSKSFSKPLTTAVFATKFSIVDKHDITLVRCNPEGGALIFYTSDQFDDWKLVVKVVSLGQMLKLDPTLSQIPELKAGFYAERTKKGQPWVVKRLKQKD